MKATLGLVALCVALFLFGSPALAFNTTAPSLAALCTCQFYHPSFEHLLCNMLVLFWFGRDFERRFGPWLLLLFCLVVGTFSTCMEVALDPEFRGLLCGASCFVMGLASVSIRDWRSCLIASPLLLSAVLTPLFPDGEQLVANWAHIASAGCGFVLAFILRPFDIAE